MFTCLAYSDICLCFASNHESQHLHSGKTCNLVRREKTDGRFNGGEWLIDYLRTRSRADRLPINLCMCYLLVFVSSYWFGHLQVRYSLRKNMTCIK